MGANKSNSKNTNTKNNSESNERPAVEAENKVKGVDLKSKEDQNKSIKSREVNKSSSECSDTEDNKKFNEDVKSVKVQDTDVGDESKPHEHGADGKIETQDTNDDFKYKDKDRETEKRHQFDKNDQDSNCTRQLRSHHTKDDDKDDHSGDRCDHAEEDSNEQDLDAKNCGTLNRNSDEMKSDTTHDKSQGKSEDNSKETQSERHVRWDTKVYVKSKDGTVFEEEPLSCDFCYAVIKRYHKYPRKLTDHNHKQQTTPERKEEPTVEQASDTINALDISDSMDLNRLLLKEEDKTKSYSVEPAEESPRDFYICHACYLQIQKDSLKEQEKKRYIS